MEGIERCGECGVPLMISEGHRWEGNGVITLAISPVNRMVFYECGNIDDLFRGIERLIGAPIEHIVIESRRRETRRYMERLYGGAMSDMSQPTREALRRGAADPRSDEGSRIFETAKALNLNINNIGRIYGYGKISLGDAWDENAAFPWRTQIIRHPYSLLFYVADVLGSVEAIEAIDMRVAYEAVGDDAYRVSVSPGEHPIELAERLRIGRYRFKPGDVSFDRCPGCGLPAEVSRCGWDLENGVITDGESGRRMALFGPRSFDAILGDLEAELGGAVPDAVIAAQRDYVRKNMSARDWNLDAESFRRSIASRGLGNLVRFEGDASSLRVTVENACLPLLMVGTTVGMVELVYGREASSCDWSFSSEGDLAISVFL